MAKRKQLLPWPDTVWHTSGRVRGSSALVEINARIAAGFGIGALAGRRAYLPESGESWWGFDASWQTGEGDRIKARLLLAPDPVLAEESGLVRGSLDIPPFEGDLFWSLTAEADRPWQPRWQSPVDAMFGSLPTYDWTTGRLFLMDETGAVELTASQLAQQFEELAACPWYIPVVTHDKRSIDEAMESPGAPLVELVPPSLRGRLLEFRVYGDQDRLVNTDGVLPESRLRLKLGGAVIVPPRPYQDKWAMADCVIRRPPGGTFEQLLKETADAVTRYAALRPHFCDRARDGVENLRTSWVLGEIPLASARVLQEKQEAEDRIRELETVLAETRDLLRSEREEARLVHAAKEAAKEELRELRNNPLSEQARQFRAAAEEAWAAQESAESEAERLTGETAYLRRLLAQVPGRSYDEAVPERPKGPESWQELFEVAADAELLPYVRVLDRAQETAKALRGHSSEKTWLRRTWEALEALNAYGAAKDEHGAQLLPHFTAYLDWPQATTVISKGMYVAAEVLLERAGSDLRARRTRLFTVPELGEEVFMGSHIRIGGGKPPAPRMHFYDDTAGPTGKVIVGHVGPHLPNWKGR